MTATPTRRTVNTTTPIHRSEGPAGERILLQPPHPVHRAHQTGRHSSRPSGTDRRSLSTLR